ncbi:MAG: hypothetical protein HZA46_12355 [Planctomycetales bacterium]|nr:hypothetical protein [Planctomycetales bacterium]
MWDRIVSFGGSWWTSALRQAANGIPRGRVTHGRRSALRTGHWRIERLERRELLSHLDGLWTGTLTGSNVHADFQFAVHDDAVTGGSISGNACGYDNVEYGFDNQNVPIVANHFAVPIPAQLPLLLGGSVSGTITSDTTATGTVVVLSPICTVVGTVTVTKIQPPTIGLTPNARSFSENGAPVVLDSGAHVRDHDSPNFDTGSLIVTISGGANADDRLELHHQGTEAGQIGITGSNVTFGGTTIGSFSGGTGTTPLTIAFNASATAAAAQALLRSVTFRTSGSPIDTAQRTIDIVVSDGDGGTSNTASRAINVVAVGTSVHVTRMHRAYNPHADYHFFTIATAEFSNAVNAGYHDETAGQSGFSVMDSLQPNTAPIHRLYNLISGRHYYTLNDFERDYLVSIGWRFEKDEGYMSTSTAPGTTTIFRLYNTNSGVHLYTEDVGTKTAILTTFAGIWVEHSPLGNAFAVIVSHARSQSGEARSSSPQAATLAGPEEFIASTSNREPLGPTINAGTVGSERAVSRSRSSDASEGMNPTIESTGSTRPTSRRGPIGKQPTAGTVKAVDELLTTQRLIRDLYGVTTGPGAN